MSIICVEISPEYMAQIESEMTQPTYVKPATTITNPTPFNLHHGQRGLEFVEIEEGYYIFPEEDEPGDDNETTYDPYPFIINPSEEDDLPF